MANMALPRILIFLLLALPGTAFGYLPSVKDLARHWEAPSIDRPPVLLEYVEPVSDGERRWRFVLFDKYWTEEFFAPGSTEPVRTYRNGGTSRRELSNGRQARLRQTFVTFDELLFATRFDRVAKRLAQAGLSWQKVTLEVNFEARRTSVVFGDTTQTAMLLDRENWLPLSLTQIGPDGYRLTYQMHYDRNHRFPDTIEIERNGALHVLTRSKGPKRLTPHRYKPYRYH